jgi:hypothetical protein
MSGLRKSPSPETEIEMGKEVEYVYDQVSWIILIRREGTKLTRDAATSYPFVSRSYCFGRTGL